jgi:hypothetical protein
MINVVDIAAFKRSELLTKRLADVWYIALMSENYEAIKLFSEAAVIATTTGISAEAIDELEAKINVLIGK